MSSRKWAVSLATALLAAVAAVPVAQAGPSNTIFAYSGGQSTELVVTTTLGQVTLSQSSRGWWDSTGGHSSGNDNYIAGVCGSGGTCNGDDLDRNNFFQFNLADLSARGTVLSANLLLSNMNANGFISANSSLTYTLFDVNSSFADVAASGSGRTDIYADLGSGSTYGSRSMSAADNGTIVSIGLNGTAISYLNSNLGGSVAFGGSVAAIPEPETYAMMLAGLGLLGFVARRRKA